MKRFRFTQSIFALMLALVAASCIEYDFDTPPLVELPVGTVLTIEDLRNACPPGNVVYTGEQSVFAIVTMDESSGNVYKNAFVQDHTGAVNLRFQSSSSLNEGDSIRIYLKGAKLSWYENLFQVDSLHPDSSVVKQATNCFIEPEVTTIRDINLDKSYFQSRLIRLNNVQIVASDTSKTWADAVGLKYGEIFIEDTLGNSMMIRSSGYAKFANQKVPSGFGSLVAVVGIFRETVQLYIRRASEVELTGERYDPWENLEQTTIAAVKASYTSGFPQIAEPYFIEAVVTADDQSGNYYKKLVIQDNTGGIELSINDYDLYQRFPAGQKIRVKLQGLYLGSYGGIVSIGGGTYESGGQTRLGGIEPSAISAFIAAIPGGVLPSPTPIDLSNINNQDVGKLVILDGVEFADSELGKTFATTTSTTNRTLKDCANKTIIVRTSNYANFAAETLPSGNGQMVAILSKFNNDFQLYIRTLNDVNLNGERCGGGTGEGTGTGTFVDPFNVAAAIANNTGTQKWVEGYIVGVMETVTSPFYASFTAPFQTNSNILLADSPTETSESKCLIVQLPFGSVRTAVNLVDNAGNLGKLLKIRGNLTAYFSVPGLKDCDGYWLDGAGINPDDETPGDFFFEENFSSNLGVFNAHSIVGAQQWSWANYDGGCAVMNGFASGAQNNEDWLVSPAINLAGKNNVTLNIREAINYITNINDMKVLVSSNFNGTSLPTESGDWVQITGFTRPAGNNWNFVDSGDIDLSDFDGETIHIAFKYNSTTSGAATWEVSKVLLKEMNK